LYAKDGLLGKTASWTKDEYASRASLFGTESAVACVADQPPGATSLDWLQHAGYKVHGPNFDARETLFAEFNGIYSAVRFYDGTRVEDPALFSVTGILPSDIEELDKRALKMFGEILLSSEPPGKVQGASPKRGNTAFLEPC
jgi:hypothetical protein